MVEMYKHFYVYDTAAISPMFQPSTRPSRHHNHQLIQHRANDGLRGVQANSFYFRTLRAWNALPRNVVESVSLSAFKNNLDSYWEGADIMYDFNAPPPYMNEELKEVH